MKDDSATKDTPPAEGAGTEGNDAKPSEATAPKEEPIGKDVPRISQPTRFDVLLGRGKPYQGHAGNIRLHKVVDLYKPRYSQARRHEKTEIAEVSLGYPSQCFHQRHVMLMLHNRQRKLSNLLRHQGHLTNQRDAS